MYDRKTWIILALCGGLLALNMHYANQNRLAEQANKPKIEETTTTTSGSPTTGEPDASLSVETPPPPTAEELVILENDEVEFTLSNIGGGIKHAKFKQQKNVNDSGNVHMNKGGPGPIAGLVAPNQLLDNSAYTYQAEQSEAGKSAVYIAKLASGIIVKKTFTLETQDIPGSEYFIDLTLSIENATQANFDLSQYDLFLGSAAPLHQKERADLTAFFWYSNNSIQFKSGAAFKGGMLSSEKSVIHSPEGKEITYAGVANQFFTTVIRPEKVTENRVWGKSSPFILKAGEKQLTSVRAGLSLPQETLAPEERTSLNYRIFIGPKANTLLRKLDNTKEAGKGWGDMMQYGWFGFVSRPLNWLLNNLHNLLDKVSTTQAWGLAIIVLTLIVRILIWPLHAKSTRSMKRMSKLQPIMKELKEKYSDDPNKLNTEMMGLYRKYGINPLGGCLPMFIQIPIFFGFFKMLLSAVELRDQPFLWVADLSQPDTLMYIGGIPINILPIVMAGTSAVQMSLMPRTGDKMQQRIMLFMPLMFFFFCYNYASALALYWTTQNIFSIGQTYLMNKIPEPELKARKDGGKKSWVQRMAEKQAEMQKAKGGSANMRNVTPDKPKKKNPRTGG